MLSPQRLGLIRSRLQVRLQAHGVPSFTWFHDQRLRSRPHGPDMQMLIDLSTVNHSAFFRESATLAFLAEQMAGRVRARLGRSGPVRAWSAGCSAGQEPFSLAMAMVERIPALDPGQWEVWASDLSLEMIEAGTRAVYDTRDLADIAPDRQRRFFLRGRGPRHGSYRVVPEVRRLVKFRHFDLRAPDWPVPSELDAILCRNVALYFAESERLPLVERLTDRLRVGGWLALGHCEILPGLPSRLIKVAPSVYRKEPIS